MDIKEQISTAVEKISKDKALQAQFMSDPVGALENVLGIDLPKEAVDKIVQGVKAKLAAGKVSDVADSLKGLFKK